MHMKCLILVSVLFCERDSPLYYLVFWEFGFAVVLKVLTLYVGMRFRRSCFTCISWIILNRRKIVYGPEPPIHISQMQQWFNRNTKHGLFLLPEVSLLEAMTTDNSTHYRDKKNYLSHNFNPAPSTVEISEASLLNRQSLLNLYVLTLLAQSAQLTKKAPTSLQRIICLRYYII